MNLKTTIHNHLKKMAYSPKAQIKQLTIGTGISAFSILVLTLVSHLELEWLFYLLVAVTAAGILYAIPGYIGIWLWRMRSILFRGK